MNKLNNLMYTFRDLYFGRQKLDRRLVVKHVINSKAFNKSGVETISDAKALLLLSSKHQNSWLVRTNLRIYKLLDDVRKSNPAINWSKSISTFGDDFINEVYHTAKVGKIIFEHIPDNGYLYSKSLFYNHETTIAEIICRFVKSGTPSVML